jgi:hypothetical protein
MRTVEELVKAIGEDLNWRRKELTELRGLIQAHRGELKERVLIRAAVALLYAHWEGFVKRCGTYYLEFVSYQRVDCDKLAANFLALSARARAYEYVKRGDILTGIELAEFYMNCTGKQARVPYKKIIDTQSNLGSTVLKEIVAVLGLDATKFSTRFPFIDSSLVNARNHVAHGEALSVSYVEYETLHSDVMTLIHSFQNEVENSAVTKAYLKAVP